MLGLLRSSYRRRDVEHLHGFLEEKGTFRFHRFANGLFPAAPFAGQQDASGYGYAWVRDNVHIAHAHYVWGDSEAAVRTANALMRFFQGQRPRMQKVAKYPRMAENAMNRPHIRFEGETMRELPEKWPHAQNDALGYFLWFYCKLAGEHRVGFGDEEKRCMADLVRYLRAIRYWKDPDSGHWEEVKKVSASSIGAVVAGLTGLQQLLESPSGREGPEKTPDRADVAGLIGKGQAALDHILPYECRGHKGGGMRRYDAALLFLIYPLRVVSGEMARRILGDVRTNLQGMIGIRRYIRDSYWCPDYRSLFPAAGLAGDFSEDLALRDAHITTGREAQWCIFDPLVACIHGLRILGNEESKDRISQTHHLNRALGQLTEGGRVPPLRCPEAYFLEGGRYTPNDQTPLYWTQANLKMALHRQGRTAP